MYLCVTLFPSFLLGLNRLCQAETYLAQAQWTMLKMQHECSNAIRSQVHRKLGLLYAAKRDYDAALESLAKDVSSRQRC